MKQLSLVLFFICILSIPVCAESTDEREFNAQKIEEYKKQSEFNYMEDFSMKDSIPSMFFRFLSSKVQGFLNSLGITAIPSILFKIILLMGFVVAVSLIVRLKFGTALASKQKDFQNFPVQFFENEKQDYKKLLDESLNNQQYKLAIRYLFFCSLNLLEQQKKLKIANWKAPYDYLKEMPDDKKANFKSIIDLFESTWYGDYKPDKQAFDLGFNHYQNLKNA